MGQIHAQGKNILSCLESLLANDPARLKDGEGHYSFITNEQGGVIDDLLVYRLSPDDFFLVVNASRHNEILQLLKKHEAPQVRFSGNPGTTTGMALQGPQASAILAQILQGSPLPLRNHIAQFTLFGANVLIATTGYTGENGYEIFSDIPTGLKIWAALLETGKPLGLLPCGLGSRDSLRLEAGLPLNGQDLSPEISPIEAGLGIFVDLNRPRPFPGRPALEKQKKSGSPRICIGLQGQPGQPPPRHGYPVFQGDKQIGIITSGVPSPTLGHGIALALVATPAPSCGQDLEFEVRGRRIPAKVTPRRFLPKK
jgi:aminomethyltransferase